ncbi:MAG: carbon-nitrogen hydrolase family protein [Lentisphaerae bacterium]|jgi:predicted amidohydrolase|nr:carbon-nitrogen hydrolase family protein [Lentisphaerota bacterium]
MHIIKVAAIAIEDKEYSSLASKFAECKRWLRHARATGVQLAVLPETVNVFWEHTPRNIDKRSGYLQNWRDECHPLICLAAELKLALTVPVLYKDIDERIYNAFFLYDENGKMLGEYRKQFLTPHEVACGVCPDPSPALMKWNNLKIGGAICFDTLYAETYQRQDGMNLLLCPSRWPGGCQLNFFSGIMNFHTVLAYSYWSRIIASDGTEVAAGGYRNETLRYGFGVPVITATINCDRQNYFGNINQEKMADLEAEYGDQIKIRFDQQNCLWTVESLSPNFTMRDLEQKHGLICRQDYLAQCASNIYP